MLKEENKNNKQVQENLKREVEFLNNNLKTEK